jgi:Putative prokaryotic signal transducing protein
MVVAGVFPNRIAAEVAQAALSVAGIPSVVEADDAGRAYPFDLTGGVRLVVAERDIEDAVAVLAAPATSRVARHSPRSVMK